MWEALHIAMISDSHRLMPPLSCLGDQLFDFWQGIHRRHIGMRVEFYPALAFWHQVLAGIMHDLLDVLDIHGQVAREIVHFDISPHPEPAVLLDHVKLLGFFLIFDPFLKRKTRGIVGHLKADQDPTGPRHLVLHIKDHTLKDNPVLFCRDLDHRSDLSLV